MSAGDPAEYLLGASARAGERAGSCGEMAGEEKWIAEARTVYARTA